MDKDDFSGGCPARFGLMEVELGSHIGKKSDHVGNCREMIELRSHTGVGLSYPKVPMPRSDGHIIS